MTVSTRTLEVLPGRLAVCRLEESAPLPAWATHGSFWSVTRSAAELSVVCPEDSVPADAPREAGWRALRLRGPLESSEVGVLAGLAAPLAGAGVSIFVISTYLTDTLLVKEEQLATAIASLRKEGHEVVPAG